MRKQEKLESMLRKKKDPQGLRPESPGTRRKKPPVAPKRQGPGARRMPGRTEVTRACL